MPKLATRESCTGCTACASVCPKACITMTADENGFLYPAVDAELCVACGRCEQVCPIISPLKKPENEPKACAVYSKDDIVRMESSSGGVFTELARAVLAEGGSVFGAAYNDRFQVVHSCVENEADLGKLRGAKYAQSDLRGVFSQARQRLKQGQQVLFSGTPCQVAGLQAFLRKPYANLITVDLVCHSVPAPMAWQAYVRYRAQQDNAGQLPAQINLRSKDSGWSNYRYSNAFVYPDGRSHTVRSSESLYMQLFGGGYLSRASCGDCKFRGYHRSSDLTLGDFWGIWEIAPDMDDNRGTSVVLIHSERGAELLHQLGERLVTKSVTLEEASRQNLAMVRSSPPNARREEALARIRVGEIGTCASWFVPKKPTWKQTLRRFIGRVLRKVKCL